MRPDPEKLKELVRRIVDAVNPLRIILFGSAVRGEMTRDSDVDVLVVMPKGTHRLDTMGFLHTKLIGLGLAVDFIVATPCDLERHRETVGYIYKTVRNKGQDLYAA